MTCCKPNYLYFRSIYKTVAIYVQFPFSPVIIYKYQEDNSLVYNKL